MAATSSSQLWRAFIAIELPASALDFVRRAQDELRVRLGDSARAVRWTKPQQMHLTLLFLGDVASDAVPHVEAALRRACESTFAFALQTSDFGCFPNARNPRVLWLGVGGDESTLHALQTKIAREVSPLCPNVDNKAFHPHLTLGRVKTFDRNQAQRIGETTATMRIDEPIEWNVGDVVLMRSELSPHGSRYTELVRVALAARSN